MSEKVVFLAFKNEHVHDEYVSFTTCSHCKNKTFTMHPSNEDGVFPMLRCAACGTNIGRVGWGDDVAL